MSICGTPSEEFLQVNILILSELKLTIYNLILQKISSEEARNYIRNMPRMERKDFKKFFHTATPEAIDFLEKTLNLDPDYRCVFLL
jgi:hypothetical protein